MFSNRSVSVHPSAPPTESGDVPDALTVEIAFTNCGHVPTRLTPAFLNDATLYQMVDLFAPVRSPKPACV